MFRHLLVAIALVFCIAAGALADGVLVPTLQPDVPNFSIKYHHVKVQIDDQVATTSVDQVFVNETDREQEATYIFPLPVGAVVKDFTLIVDGKRMEGELLPREKAVSIYEEIVRKRRDPALLEYSGRGMYKARVFPVPARAERRVELHYTEVLPYDNGLVAYNYPMSTEKFSNQPIKETVFEATIHSKLKIGTVYSPSHDIDVARHGNGEAVASYEEKNSKPDRDLLLYYSLPKDEVGATVLTFKEKGEDGFFLLLASPSQEDEEAARAVAKNVIFVLDRSGSMQGEKVEQARRALKFCVDSLNPQDSFQIITFATGITTFSDEGLVKATPKNIEKARSFIADIKSSGGTDIDGALHEALKNRAKGVPNYIAFLTDGLPTAGEVTAPDKITARIKEAAGDIKDTDTPTRIFDFGVGYDVDTHFLDQLAEDNNGISTYVRPNEDIEIKISNWYAKIAQPVLTQVDVDFGRVKTYDVLPRDMPDLFAGSQLAVFGRYKNDTAGKTMVTVKGDSGHGKRSFAADAEFPEVREGTDYIASLWASRKIGYLLDQIRLHGKSDELVQEIVDLSTKYGILTEYTAFLADDDNAVAPTVATGRALDSMGKAFNMRQGGWATSQTQNAQEMRATATQQAQNRYLDAEGREVQVQNLQNRGQRGFVQRQGQWQDMRYNAERDKVALQVQAYSEAHFQLSRAFPELNNFLAVSDDMIVMVNGQAVQIGKEGKTQLTDDELKALAVRAAASSTTPGASLTPGTEGATPQAPHPGSLAVIAVGALALIALMGLRPRLRRPRR
jgi:Ca-activated chloride channel family protein